MPNEEEAIYKVKADLDIGGKRVPIIEIKVVNEVNNIPYAYALLPLWLSNATAPGSTSVSRSSDPANNAHNLVYDICKNAQDDDTGVSISIETIPIGGVTAGFGGSFGVSGWRISETELEPQNRVSPGGVRVTLKHPMIELTESSGFFRAPGVDYEKELDENKKSTNIIEAADNVLDLISEAIDANGYTQLKLGITEDYDAVKSNAKSIRLKNWIECDSSCNKFPFHKVITSKDFDAACSTAFALNYKNNIEQSGVFGALINMCMNLGLYVAPELDGSKKAALKVLDPWSRKGVKNHNNYEIYQTAITRDKFPLCGVRLFETARDTQLVSTFANAKPIANKVKSTGGEIVYCFGTEGAMLNTTIPPFVHEIFKKLHKILASRKVSAFATSSIKRRASNTTWTEPSAVFNAIGGTEAEKLSALDKLQASVAKMIFISQYRKSQMASVTKPFVDGNDILKIGSFSKFKTGTGGDTTTGLVTRVELTASCTRGTCSVTITSAYCGLPARMKINKKKTAILHNDMWDDAEKDSKGNDGSGGNGSNGGGGQ